MPAPPSPTCALFWTLWTRADNFRKTVSMKFEILEPSNSPGPTPPDPATNEEGVPDPADFMSGLAESITGHLAAEAAEMNDCLDLMTELAERSTAAQRPVSEASPEIFKPVRFQGRTADS